MTALPGLVREAQDEVDTLTGSEDRPGVTAGRMAAERIRDILEDLWRTAGCENTGSLRLWD